MPRAAYLKHSSEIFKKINDARKAKGLKQLKWNGILSQEAHNLSKKKANGTLVDEIMNAYKSSSDDSTPEVIRAKMQ